MIEVILKAGSKLAGKFRLVNKRGVEITEEVNNSIRATLQRQLEEVIGKVILADSEGNPLEFLNNLSDIHIIHSLKLVDKTVSCPPHPMEIPGIGTGSAYTANDCLGTMAVIDVPKSGVIYSATFWDLDDEGSQVDLEIFKDSIAQIADNGAWSPTDFDMLNFVTELAFFSFDVHINSQTSELRGIGKAYTAPSGKLWVQAVTRSTPNIATQNIPRFQLQIISDDPDWEV